MDRMESDFIESGIFKCLRYIDNVFLIWTEGKVKLKGFLNRLNNFYPNLKFTHGKPNSSVSFLDVSVSIVDSKLETDLYFEPTDLRQFLHFDSAHLFHNAK